MSNVLYEKRDGVAYVTLDRPEAMNAIDEATDMELTEVWRDFAADLKTFIPKWERANMLDVRKNIPMAWGARATPSLQAHHCRNQRLCHRGRLGNCLGL